MGRAPGDRGRLALDVRRRPTDKSHMTGPTPAGEPTDTRRVIRLPRATRLLATLLAAWLVCAAVALVVVWFTPLNLEHGRQVRFLSPPPCPAGIALVAGSCYDPYRAVQPAWPAMVI